MTQWRWVASFSASCLHSVQAILGRKKIVDPRLAELLTPLAHGLDEQIRVSQIPPAPFWRHLLSLSHQVESDRELVHTALRKTVGIRAIQETVVTGIAGRITQLEGAMQSAVPNMLDQITLRSKPLRELFEAYGTGLLKSIGRHTDDRLVVDRAEIVLVYPVTGGGGGAHLQTNSVRIEAVLTNNVEKLPEVVRLVFLIAQLNNDVPMFSEKVHAERLPDVVSLAMLPATLQAAQELDLCPADDNLVELALAAWLDRPPREGLGDILGAWWHTYQESRPDWATALQALDKMLLQ